MKIMGWEHFNLNLLEAFDFEITAEHLVLRVFESASEALDDEWKNYVKRFDARMSKGMDESQVGYAFSERDWEERLHRQRMQGVGALALDWLMCSFQGALHSAKKYLDASHPPNPDGYKGGNWLSRASNEYQQRFGNARMRIAKHVYCPNYFSKFERELADGVTLNPRLLEHQNPKECTTPRIQNWPPKK
jgi:hypothetical protein